MGLTEQLWFPDSPVSRFFRTEFPHTRSIIRAANKQLEEPPRIVQKGALIAGPDDQLPVGIQQALDEGHLVKVKSSMWGLLRDDLLGMALECRLRYYFGTPSLIAVETGMQKLLRDSVPKKVILGPQQRMGMRDGRWVIEEVPPKVPKPLLSFKLVEEFITRFEEAVLAISPVGQILGNEAEAELVRYCILFSIFEKACRERSLDIFREQPFSNIQRMKRIERLLALPQDHWIEHLVVLSRFFFAQCRDLIGQPAVINPRFVAGTLVGGAEADLIVGDCLIDVKMASKLNRRQLYQLLAYALLDSTDEYGIRTAALYSGTTGVLLRWSLDELLSATSGKSLSLERARGLLRAALLR